MLDLMFHLPSPRKTATIRITKKMVEDNDFKYHPSQASCRRIKMQTHDKNEAIKNVPMIPLRDLVVFPSTLGSLYHRPELLCSSYGAGIRSR